MKQVETLIPFAFGAYSKPPRINIYLSPLLYLLNSGCFIEIIDHLPHAQLAPKFLQPSC